MASITTVSRTASGSMLSLALSAASPVLPPICMTASGFHGCWIAKMNITMPGQIKPTQVSALRICLALVALRAASTKRAHAITLLVTQPKSVIALSQDFRLVLHMYLAA